MPCAISGRLARVHRPHANLHLHPPYSEERQRKKEARKGHKASEDAQNLRGLRAKLHQQARRKEKIQMRKQIKAHEERDVKNTAEKDPSTPMPSYLLDRSNPTAAKALSSAIKNKRNEKSARFSVPLPKVKGISEEEMFRVVSTGKKTAKKGWKRMVTKPTFVGYVDGLFALDYPGILTDSSLPTVPTLRGDPSSTSASSVL